MYINLSQINFNDMENTLYYYTNTHITNYQYISNYVEKTECINSQYHFICLLIFSICAFMSLFGGEN